MRLRLSRPWLPTSLLLAAGLLLRLVWLAHHPSFAGDPLLYATIARNWLAHGVYGYAVDGHGQVVPTLIRLPGYPLFLALCFRLFGPAHLLPVLVVQVVVDLGTALLAACTAERLAGRQAGLWTLAFAATCPFLANYTAVPLTETLELFTIALGFFLYAQLAPQSSTQGWMRVQAGQPLTAPELRSTWNTWIPGRLAPTLLLAAAWSYAALLRPDGALLAVALSLALLVVSQGRAWRPVLLAGVLSVLPFVPWTMRNWRTFHVLQPLAPRYATDPGEPIHPGFQAWTKTVCADFTCTQEIYWNLDSDVLDPGSLPKRAFDTPAQYLRTKALLDDYNRMETLTPAQDEIFASLAAERRQAHPVRSRIGLPLLRLADMFLRPRLELTGRDLRWWQWSEHPGETVFGYAYAALNLIYLILAARGALRRPPLLGAILLFALLRSALLLTIEAPEQRYTLELLPLEFVLAGVGLSGGLPASPSEPSS